jgi:hypothetical protein
MLAEHGSATLSAKSMQLRNLNAILADITLRT